MRNIFVLVSVSLLFLSVSCEKKTETVIHADGGSTTVEKVGFDEEKIDSTAQNIKEDAKEAAEKTGEALEKAGEAIKDGTNKAGHNIEEATDGDGDPKK